MNNKAYQLNYAVTSGKNIAVKGDRIVYRNKSMGKSMNTKQFMHTAGGSFSQNLSPHKYGPATYYTGATQVNSGVHSSKEFSRLVSAGPQMQKMFPTIDSRKTDGNIIQSGVFNLTDNFQRVKTLPSAKAHTINSWARYGSTAGASRKRLKAKKSGIAAIDNYYDKLNTKEEVDCLRYSTEFRRLITMI